MMKLLLGCLIFTVVTLDSCGATLSGYFQNDFDPSQSDRIEKVHAAAAVFNYEKSYHSSRVSVPDNSIFNQNKTPFVEKKPRPDRSLTLYVEYYGKQKDPQNLSQKKETLYQFEEINLTFKKIKAVWVAKTFSTNSFDVDHCQADHEQVSDQPPESFTMHLTNDADDIKVNVVLTYPDKTVFYNSTKTAEQPDHGDLIRFN